MKKGKRQLTQDMSLAPFFNRIQIQMPQTLACRYRNLGHFFALEYVASYIFSPLPYELFRYYP